MVKRSFWSYVNQAGDCWLWLGPKNEHGYGKFQGGQAHRYSYELLVGPIPAGLKIDHLCHTASCRLGDECPHRACVNPEHLEPKTQRENLLRGAGFAATKAAQTHCIHDHEFTEANTYWKPSAGRRPSRQCRACIRARRVVNA